MKLINYLKIAAGILALAAAPGAQAAGDILNASYDVSRELFAQINPVFVEYWKAKSGQTVEVNLEALASMSNVPAKFLRYLVNSPAYQQLRLQYEERDKEDRNRQDRVHEFASRLAEIHQQEIDNNKLTFSVNGKDIEISQGDLRKIMQRRVDELKERQKALLLSGENPEELARISGLIQAYEPAIDEMKKEKADAKAMGNVRNLMEKDPLLEDYIDNHSKDNIHTANNRRSSYSSEHFGPGAVAGTAASSYLRDSFAKQVTPDLLPPVTSPSKPDAGQQKVEPPAQNPKNNLEHLGL